MRLPVDFCAVVSAFLGETFSWRFEFCKGVKFIIEQFGDVLIVNIAKQRHIDAVHVFFYCNLGRVADQFHEMVHNPIGSEVDSFGQIDGSKLRRSV